MNYRSNQKRLWKNLNNSTTVSKNKTTANTYLPELMLFIMTKAFYLRGRTVSLLYHHQLSPNAGHAQRQLPGGWEELHPVRPCFSKWGPGTVCTTVTLDAGLKSDLWSSGFSPNMLPPDPKHSLTFQGDPQPPHQSRQTSHARPSVSAEVCLPATCKHHWSKR